MARTDLGDALVVRLEADLKNFELGMDKATKRVQVFDKTTGQVAGGVTKLTGTTDKLGKTAQKSASGVGELRESFASLASQMAGVHPISGKLLSVFGSLAIGSTVMIGVLGGLAALGAAWQGLTKDTEKAREETEKAITKIRELQMEAETAGDIDFINRYTLALAERNRILDDIAKRERAPATTTASGGTTAIIGDPLAGLRKELAQAQKDADAAFAQLTARRDERKARAAAQAKAEADGVKKVATAHEDATKAVEEHTEKLDDLVAAMRGMLGLRLPLLLPAPGAVTPVNPPTAEEILAPSGKAPSAAFAQLSAQATDLAQAFTPLGLASNLLNTVFANFGTTLQPIIDILASALTPVIQVLVKAFSYVTQAIGWFVRAIGKAVNFLLPGNPANGLVRFGQSMIDASKAARDFSTQTNAMAASMRNVPLIFNAAHAGYRVGMGDTGRSAVARGGFVNNGSINVNVDSASTWASIRRQMTTAAAAGDPLARGLLKAG